MLDELRREHAKRLARLKMARDLLGEARFPEIIDDGTDIFNAAIEDLQQRIDDLLSGFD